MTTDEDFANWVNSFYDYMEPEDGKIFIIKKPDDITQVYEELEALSTDVERRSRPHQGVAGK